FLGLPLGFLLGLYICEAVRQEDWRKGLTSAWIAMKALGLGILIEVSLAMLSTIAFAVAVVVRFVSAGPAPPPPPAPAPPPRPRPRSGPHRAPAPRCAGPGPEAPAEGLLGAAALVRPGRARGDRLRPAADRHLRRHRPRHRGGDRAVLPARGGDPRPAARRRPGDPRHRRGPRRHRDGAPRLRRRRPVRPVRAVPRTDRRRLRE